MVQQLIGLCGYAGVGKDEAAKALIAYGWCRVAFADGVREALLALNPALEFIADGTAVRLAECVNVCGWEEAKRDREVRRLMQRMGTEAGRQIHGDDCWIKLAKRKIDAAPGPVVVTDVRFANEAEAIRSWGGKIIRIERPGVGPCNGHASEKLEFEADSAIDNFGTIEDLHAAIRHVAKSRPPIAIPFAIFAASAKSEAAMSDYSWGKNPNRPDDKPKTWQSNCIGCAGLVLGLVLYALLFLSGVK